MPHEIIRQLLRHPLRERSDKNALPPFDTDGDLFHQVINLVLRRSDNDLRIQQSCGTNQLLHYHATRLAELKVSRRGRDIDHLMHQALKLVKLQWAVVESRGQTKSILHQIFLARTVSPIHRVDLRHGDMTLVNHHQIVLRKEVQQTVRTLPRFPPVEIAGVVLDTRTMAQLLDHLQVILHPLRDALRLDGVAYLLKESDLLPQSILYLTDRRVLLLLSRDKEVGRIDLVRLKRSLAVEGDGVQLLDGIDLVVPPRHP